MNITPVFIPYKLTVYTCTISLYIIGINFTWIWSSDMELDDYFKLNSHYLTNCGLFLTSWINYKKSQQRLDTVFKSDDPCDWITEMEKFTKENPETFTIDMAPEVSKILEKVQIVMTLYM